MFFFKYYRTVGMWSDSGELSSSQIILKCSEFMDMLYGFHSDCINILTTTENNCIL